MNRLFLISLVLTSFIFQLISDTPLVSAKESSPAPSPISAVETKLNLLKQEIASKAAQIKSQISKKIQNKAYAGVVAGIQGDNLTLLSRNGNRSVVLNNYTVFQDTLGKKRGFSPADIKQDDFIIALGDVDDKSTLTARKLIRTKKINPPDRQAVWGQVRSVYVSTLVVKGTDNQTINVTTTPDTVFRMGSDDATLSDAKIGRYLIAVGEEKDNKNLSADFVYLPNPK